MDLWFRTRSLCFFSCRSIFSAAASMDAYMSSDLPRPRTEKGPAFMVISAWWSRFSTWSTAWASVGRSM